MGDVGVVYKVMPDSTDTSLNEIKKKITDAKIPNIKIHSITEKPIAFGLKCLEVQIITPDANSNAEAFERMLSNIPGVQSVEVTGTGLI
ncbi:MAG: elongation factor 1-beta [Thermoplasmata archaeon]